MGIFADWAERFAECGLQPVPIEPGSKILRIKGHEFFKIKFDQKRIENVIENYGDWHIGIACGRVSGVIAFDFDYEKNNDEAQKLERAVLGILEPSPIIKKGAKGWTRFYKYNSKIKNTQLKKNGEVFADILTDGKVTVMPPSPHSKPGVTYKYLSEDNFEDVSPNELPEITPNQIQKIKELLEVNIDVQFGAEDQNKKASRHHTCFMRVFKTTDQLQTTDEVVKDLLKFDLLVHKSDPKGPYFDDPKYLKNKPKFEAALAFVNGIISWKQGRIATSPAQWKLGQSSLNFWELVDERTNKYAMSKKHKDYCTFFESVLDDPRREIFSNAVVSKIEGKWRAVENRFPALESLARQVGLVPTLVSKDFYQWAESLEPEFLFDIPHWDGKDHISQAFDFLKFSRLTNDVAVDLFKEWFSRIFERAFDPNVQNKFIIISGEQGLGKDRFLNHVLKGFGSYFSEIILGPNQIENYKSAEGVLISYIPEFDQTSKIANSIMKAFVTSNRAKFRASYARQAEMVEMHHSCISTVNLEDVFRDTTGNRRYAFFEVSKIDYQGIESNINPDQILAQAFQLFTQKYRAKSSSHKVMDTILNEMTPEESREFLKEQVKDEISKAVERIEKAKTDYFRNSESVYINKDLIKNNFKLTWNIVADDMIRLSRVYRVPINKTQMIMKEFVEPRKSDGIRHYVPKPNIFD